MEMKLHEKKAGQASPLHSLQPEVLLTSSY
jgi:hypothetical protein